MVQVLTNESIISQVRKDCIDAVDLFELEGRLILLRIETPFEQALAAQDFVGPEYRACLLPKSACRSSQR